MFRHPARIFAPLSLVVCAIAVLMIVNHNSSSGGGTTTTSTTTGTRTTATTKKPVSHKRTYIVRSGDTLSAIAIRTGVPLATVQQLNPTVDAQSLHAGQKLKLEP